MKHYPTYSLFFLGLCALFWVIGTYWTFRRIPMRFGKILFIPLALLILMAMVFAQRVTPVLNYVHHTTTYILSLAITGTLAAVGLCHLYGVIRRWLGDQLRRSAPAEVDLSRRDSVFLMGAGFASLGGGGLFGPALLAPQKLRRMDYSLDGDALGLKLTSPLRVAFFSDLHAGFFLPSSQTQDLLTQLQHAQPDVIIFGGDAVDHHWHSIKELDPLFKGCVDLALTVAVLGNHDHDDNPVNIANHLDGLGVTVLQDQLYHLPSGVVLAGVGDAYYKPEGHSCLLQAKSPCILIAHNPMTLFSLSPQALATTALMLSGHTHGGQVVLPGLGPMAFQADPRLISGLVTLENKPPVVVTRGVGFASLPIRIGSPPEWVMIDIQVNTNHIFGV